MNQTRQVSLRILRLKDVQARCGDCRSGMYQKLAAGLLPKAVRVGARSVGIPEHEVQAVIAARIAGHSDEEIRALVVALEASRVTLFVLSNPVITSLDEKI